MKLVEMIKERSEIRKQVDAAVDAGNQAFSDAFAKALRIDPLKVESGTTLGIGNMDAKFDTGFRLEKVLEVTSSVHRRRLYRFLKEKGSTGQNQ